MSTTTVAAAVAKVTVTIVGKAGALLTTTLPAAPTATRAASASIFDPSKPNPVAFDPSDPIALFIVQATIIIAFSRILGFFLGRLRQPRVISEVIGGILLGPSVFGRIPNFTANIFPPPSLPYLNLVATIGLIFFLFLVGLEVDFSLFRRNVRAASSISFFGMAVPFALGAAVSKGIYDRFVDESKVKFGIFLLFIGTANAITAFPVLARILTELDLLNNEVGVVVLSAGVGNDVCGWILLALAIALVNASSGIIVLYVLLTSVGWVLTLWFIIRPLLVVLCRRTGSFGEKGPTQGVVCVVIFLVLGSAWLTDRIGIHAIFGGFIVGLIIPSQIRADLTSKIEDLVTVLFLPLYFALSGLKTDLGLLANGSIWGWTVCVIIVAFAGKFVSCGLAAKGSGMDWRESGAVGSLMACKGLVELIVLNIGLSAGILNPEVFAMFVTMALVTTFVTTPLTIAFYPLSYRIKKQQMNLGIVEARTSQTWSGNLKSTSRFAVVLERFDHLPAVIAFCRLIKAPIQFGADTRPNSMEKAPTSEYSGGAFNVPEITVDALRLIELSARPSDLIKASESQETLLAADTLSQIFRTYAIGSGITTTTSISVLSQDSYSGLVATHAAQNSSDMVILPWVLSDAKVEEGVAATLLPNPFESMFRRGSASREGSPQYATFVRKVFAEVSCDVGVFLHRGMGTESFASGKTHLFFAFHGGSDDRTALDLIVQLASRNQGISATVVRILPSAEATAEDNASKHKASGSIAEHSSEVSQDSPILLSQLTVHGGGATDTIYPTHNDPHSDSADNISLSRWFDPSSSSATPSIPSHEVQDALTRIKYTSLSSVQPLHMTIARARATASSQSIPLTVVVGRGRRDAKSHTNELAAFLKTNIEAVQAGIASSSEVRRSMGDLGVAYLVSGVGNSVLVVQSAGAGGMVKAKEV